MYDAIVRPKRQSSSWLLGVVAHVDHQAIQTPFARMHVAHERRSRDVEQHVQYRVIQLRIDPVDKRSQTFD